MDEPTKKNYKYLIGLFIACFILWGILFGGAFIYIIYFHQPVVIPNYDGILNDTELIAEDVEDLKTRINILEEKLNKKDELLLEKSESTETQSNASDDTFQKKKDCIDMKDEIEKDYMFGFKDVRDVFYSPVKDSCLYTTSLDSENASGTQTIQLYELFDALTNKKIYSVFGSEPAKEGEKNLLEAQIDFENEVSKYK
jgi:hypothetical protein